MSPEPRAGAPANDVSGIPAGYESFSLNGTIAVVAAAHAGALRDALATGSVYAWAASRPGAEAMRGRGVAWGVSLSDGTAVVVRRSRHGGLLAPLTGELFLAPTRAPRELAASGRLHASGVATPALIAYVVYPAYGPLCRADVVTARLRGEDFPAAWRAATSPGQRDVLMDALGALLRSLAGAGAHHPDLNLKNVFVGRDGTRASAWLLDVDRVGFGAREDTGVASRNLARVLRSIEKWRTEQGLPFEPADVERLRSAAGAPSSPAPRA